MNEEAIRQIARWRAARERMGAPPVKTPVVPKPAPRPEKPIQLIQEQVRTPVAPVIIFGFWGYHALTPANFRKTAAMILDEVAESTGFTVQELKGRSRRAPVVAARHFAIWRIRKECPHMSFPQIAKLMGGRDHTSCLHAFHRMEKLRAESPAENLAA
jgi:Bacterial dnaA protein helix-turn-helix